MMKCKEFLMLIFALLFLPGWTSAVSEKDFEAQTTQELVNLCTAAPGDPLYQQAVNFCHGYLVGAYKYYEAAHSGPNAPKLVMSAQSTAVAKQFDCHVHRVGQGPAAILERVAGRDEVSFFN